jgi:ABC-type phosphonate transport system ATPase subunit
MKVAKRFEGLAKTVILGLIVAAFAIAPLGVMADGLSTGQPGQPTDSTLTMPVIDDPTAAYEPIVMSSVYLSLLRLIDL